MDLFDAILLGIVQGATEFLPISSSGHLVLGQYILGLNQPPLLFDIVLHVGTLAAVLGFYRRDLGLVSYGLYRGARRALESPSWRTALEPEGARLALLIAIGTIPTAILGVAVDEFLPVERGTLTAAIFVCAMLVLNGAILFSGRWAQGDETVGRDGTAVLWNITIPVALALGVAQGLAVLPGLSRSGLTIVAALLLGVWRDQAARFSFLLSVPAILGALVLKFDPAVFSGPGYQTQLAIFGAGAAVAAFVGYIAIDVLVKVIERAQFHHFSWYCWAVGALGLVVLL